MNKIKNTMIGILSATMILTTSSVAFGEKEDMISQDIAKKDAVQFLQISKDFYPQWKGLVDLKVHDEQVLYDFDGNVNAYVFSVKDDKQDRGYIIESAVPTSPGLVEAATGGEHPYKNVKLGEGIFVGPSAHFKKIDNDNFIELKNNRKIERKSLEAKGMFTRESMQEGLAKTSNLEGQNNLATVSTNATSSSGRYIYSVPDIPWYKGIGLNSEVTTN